MFLPMLTLVFLTVVVGGFLLRGRVAAVRQQKVSLGYFRLNSGEPPPPKVQAAANHFSNLFEVPVLFYVAGTLSIVLNFQTIPMQVLAWIFVISRIVHAYIHLTSNNVIRRMLAFATGVTCVLGLWLLLALHLFARGSLF